MSEIFGKHELPGSGRVDIGLELGKDVAKPWGVETPVYIDRDQGVIVRKIVINKGEKTSVQQHPEKAESFMCCKGVLVVSIATFKPGDKVWLIEQKRLGPGQSITIEPGTIHYSEAGDGDSCTFFELANENNKTDRILDWPENVARRKGADKPKQI